MYFGHIYPLFLPSNSPCTSPSMSPSQLNVLFFLLNNSLSPVTAAHMHGYGVTHWDIGNNQWLRLPQPKEKWLTLLQWPSVAISSFTMGRSIRILLPLHARSLSSLIVWSWPQLLWVQHVAAMPCPETSISQACFPITQHLHCPHFWEFPFRTEHSQSHSFCARWPTMSLCIQHYLLQ